jgi:hypothetical protein
MCGTRSTLLPSRLAEARRVATMMKLEWHGLARVALLTLALTIPSGPLGSEPTPAAAQPGSSLLTIFLRHDQTKTLDEINEHLRQTGWYGKFPPSGTEIVSWYVMMGIGQVVTLRVPADKLRELNRVIETSAWGAYRTEFYPTYDYRQAWEEQKKRAGTP